MIPAGKVLDPARTIPRATLIGTLVTAASVCVFPIVPDAVDSAGAAEPSPTRPFADLFGQYLGAQYGHWLALFIVISGLGALEWLDPGGGELTQTFAKHGDFPAALGSCEQSGDARCVPSCSTGAAASVILWFNYDASMAKVFTFLSVLVTASNLPVYLAGSLCGSGALETRRDWSHRPARGAVDSGGTAGGRLLHLGICRGGRQAAALGAAAGRAGHSVPRVGDLEAPQHLRLQTA